MNTTYADSGVNIELGDDVSKILYNAAKETWKNREGKVGEIIVPYDDFSGVRVINISNLPEDTLLGMESDGVGTKMELAERIGDHTTIAYDLIAMAVEDTPVKGAEPIAISTVLDVNSLTDQDGKPFTKEIKQLAKGYINAARDANVAIMTGEVAELGNRVGGFGPFNYNWSATVISLAKKERMFTGKEIKEGDYLVGFKEEGFRSNGLSLVRKIMNNLHGEDWHNHLINGESVAKLALQPSKIYTKAIVEMFGGYDQEPQAEIHGIAHITGGGLPGKLGRMLKPSGLGAKIDNPFEPSLLMLYCQEEGNVSDREAYTTWNMRHGVVAATPTPDKAMGVAEKHGIVSDVIGKVTANPGISIKNKGYYSILNF